MAKRTQLKEHIYTLNEIGSIMTAMKNLSLIEINKVMKFISTQERVVDNIKDVGKDFLHFYPGLYSYIQVKEPSIYILMGSERGFCGGFNDNIIKALANLKLNQDDLEPRFIVVGRKLAMKMSDDKRIVKVIDGPNAAEEIPTIILNLINSIETIPSPRPNYWAIISCEESQNIIQAKIMQPFVEFKNEILQPMTILPLLNIDPEMFLFEFINHYLFSILYLIFYKSFISENYQRLHHLDNALERLENKVIYLTHHLNLLRQEEITQEIQVIMLSAEAIMDEIQNKDDLKGKTIACGKHA
jgi:F-type H+-transporting ATPase subunit gamma